MAVKRGCYGNVNVGAHDKTTLKYSQIIFRTFTRGGRVQNPPGQKRVKFAKHWPGIITDKNDDHLEK